MQTYNDIYLDVRRRLRENGVTEFELEARLILCAASNKTREEFTRDRQLYVRGEDVEKTAREMTARRLKGEPVAYLVGEWEFYSLPIKVTKDVLIPRTDTEVLAETAIHMLKSRVTPGRVLDLCAGSGCVGLAIAASVRNCRVVLAEKDPDAQIICKINIRENKLLRHVTCIEADALEPPPKLLGSFDIIVCNPPYIPSADIAELDDSVKLFEPHAALDGGEDGLDFFRAISARWRPLLRDGGILAFECGMGQAPYVRAIMLKNDFARVSAVKDTRGIERVVIGQQ
jgi:release factor glutamine methyltransferase